MKIIDIGICIDNNDPKGIGRIRYIPYGQYKSEIEHSMEYTAWDDNDQFIAIPFLPAHINVIPQLRQSIKLIKYDTDKDTQNVEYVLGPFSTPHDFINDTYIAQHKNTTYGGVIMKDIPDIRDSEGNYRNKKTEGTLSKLNHTKINGHYGADAIFTENGLVLRGGYLATKDTKNKSDRKAIREMPVLAEKTAKLTLKKFSKTMQHTKENATETQILVSKIRYIIEYELDSLSSPTKISIYAYKVLDTYSSLLDTDKFNQTTDLDYSKTSQFKLINTDNLDTPTYTIDVYNIDDALSEMRNFLFYLNEESLNYFDYRYSTEDTHPFYFRPTENFRLLSPINLKETENKNNFISNVNLPGSASGHALSFSKTELFPPTKTIETVTKKIKETNTGEQTFGSITADKIYFLSTNTKNNNGSLFSSIDFTKLDKYEYTQEDYISKIDPNTYALVRGEILVKILALMHEYLVGHVHNINLPSIYFENIEQQLKEMIENMNIDLLNQSMRIN